MYIANVSTTIYLHRLPLQSADLSDLKAFAWLATHWCESINVKAEILLIKDSETQVLLAVAAPHSESDFNKLNKLYLYIDLYYNLIPKHILQDLYRTSYYCPLIPLAVLPNVPCVMQVKVYPDKHYSVSNTFITPLEKDA